jgi:hypothetical protein
MNWTVADLSRHFGKCRQTIDTALAYAVQLDPEEASAS